MKEPQDKPKRGWCVATVNDVGKVATGNTPPKKEKGNYGTYIPFVKPPELLDCAIDGAADCLSENGAKKGRIATAYSVLVSCIGNLGKTGINSTPVAFNQQINAIQPYDEIDARFVFYQAQSPLFRSQLEEFSSATTISIVNKGNFEKLRFLLAPVNEQKRIVAKIEQLFSELDEGIEVLKTARKQLTVYRQAVLDHCLRPTEDQSVEYRFLGDVIGPIQQGWSPKCDLNKAPDDDEWAIIKTTVVQPMQYVPNECKPLPKELEPRPGIEIRDGDLLMTRKGPRPRTGVVCLVRGARKKSMLCDTVYRFRADETQLSPEYLEIALNSPRVVAEINMKKSGINESGISLNHGKIKSVQVPVATTKKRQNDIVSTVREKFSVIEKVDQELEAQLSIAKVLRQSVLKAAFSGHLVKQDPDDEPASELLQKIRAEKKKGENAKKSKKKARRKNVA